MGRRGLPVGRLLPASAPGSARARTSRASGARWAGGRWGLAVDGRDARRCHGCCALGANVVLLAPGSSAAARSLFGGTVAAGAGAAYGCFSNLWHCCAAPWMMPWRAALLDVGWFAALALLLAAVARTAVAARRGAGEVAGGLAFAVLYPWHTPLFAAQAFLGGALATWLVRASGSAWAPTLFLALAYATHVVFPVALG